MKPALWLCCTLLTGLGGGYFFGRQAGHQGTRAAAGSAAAAAAEEAEAAGTRTAAGSAPKSAAAAGTAGRGAAAVQSLLAGFDRKKPVESNLRLLQKILAASPEQLADIVRGTSGSWRNDPGWNQAKDAAMQRWVEVAPDAALAWARQAHRQGDHRAERVFGVLAETDPARALAEAKALGPSSLRQRALHHVMDSIARTDPQEALRISAELPRSISQGMTWSIFHAWSQLDPAGAAAGIAQLTDLNQRQQAIQSVAYQWAERDPSAALAWIQSVPETNMQLQAMQNIFGRLGQLDPQQALTLAETLPGNRQRQAHQALLGGWCQSDPAAVEEWLRGRPEGADKQQLIKFALNFAEALTPERAASLAGTLAPGPNRDEAMKNLMGHWAHTDPAQARAFLDTLPQGEHQRLIPIVANGMAQNSPEDAIAFLQKHPIEDPAHPLWQNIAATLTDQTSPAKALAWARELPDEVTQRKVLPEILSRLAGQNPQEAAREALALTSPGVREESLARIGNQWGQDNFQEALGWARTLTGKDRENALGAVLNQGANQEPSLAASHYTSLLAEVPAGETPADSLMNAARSITSTYFSENQEKATAWVATLSQEDARATATQELASRWVYYDAVAASEWIGTLPGGKPRDQAVSSLVNGIADSDPAMAFEWAATVREEADRASLLERSLSSWRKLDPETARQAVLNTSWPEEEKTKWLMKLR